MSCFAGSTISVHAHLKVYRELLGIPLLARALVYDVSSGVLLSRNLHHRSDRLEWSFYHQVRLRFVIVHVISLHWLIWKDDVYYLHFFVTSRHSVYHGKSIKTDGFRVKFPYQLPNPKLCLWHYAQCVQAHIRGFPVQTPYP